MRSRIFTVLSALVLGLATVPPGLPAEAVKNTVIPVTDQISMLSGKGGNIGLFKGTSGPSWFTRVSTEPGRADVHGWMFYPSQTVEGRAGD